MEERYSKEIISLPLDLYCKYPKAQQKFSPIIVIVKYKFDDL